MDVPHPDSDVATLPKADFAFPGPLRDKLVRAILDGTKTSTTSLAVEYDPEVEPLPQVGTRSVLVDSDERPVAILQVSAVRVVPLGEVDLDHAVDEGEGHTSVAQWRRDHEDFWHSAEAREALGDPGFVVDDATSVVLERFHVTERLG